MGKVIVRRTIKILLMPERILKLEDHWRKSSQSQQYGNKLEFLDRRKAKFDWENEDIEEDEGLVEPDLNPITYPGILAEIPGVIMESGQEIATTDIEVVPVHDRVNQVAAARLNANFAQNPGVPLRKKYRSDKGEENTSICD